MTLEGELPTTIILKPKPLDVEVKYVIINFLFEACLVRESRFRRFFTWLNRGKNKIKRVAFATKA
jgi:purine-nucleoside phosphorylase